MLSRRCVTLLKMALKPDVWPNCDLKLSAFEKILAGPQGVDSNQVRFLFVFRFLRYHLSFCVPSSTKIPYVFDEEIQNKNWTFIQISDFLCYIFLKIKYLNQNS